LCAELAARFEVAFHMTRTTVLDRCLASLTGGDAVADVPFLFGEDGMTTVDTRQGQAAGD